MALDDGGSGFQSKTYPTISIIGCALWRVKIWSSNGAHGCSGDSGGCLITLAGIGQPRVTAHRHNTSHNAVLNAVGTFLVLAGIAVGVLTLRFALVLIHGVMH